MDGFWRILGEAVGLILAWDPDLIEIIGLSLRVTLTAVAVACVIGLPLGAVVGAFPFPGRTAATVVLNALMGLPPVVVGLIVYLMLSAAGPLGPLDLLYTPTAMIIAQTIIVAPIVAALTRQVVEDLHREYAEQFSSLEVGPFDRVVALLWDARYSLLTGGARRLRPCGGRGRRGHHRGRQHQPRDPGDDHDHRPGNVERQSAARPGARCRSCFRWR